MEQIKMLTWVTNRCLNGKEILQQWKVAYISSIHKKGSKKDCFHYRGISVTSVMSRLYGKILRDLIEEENIDGEVQIWFRTGRSCTDNIFCLKQFIEKGMQQTKKTIYFLWIWQKRMTVYRYQKPFIFCGFDKSVWQYTDIKTSENFGTIKNFYNLIKPLQNLYGNTAQVKIGYILSHPFNITKGLRQGCCISPTLFKIYIRKALEEWKRKS